MNDDAYALRDYIEKQTKQIDQMTQLIEEYDEFICDLIAAGRPHGTDYYNNPCECEMCELWNKAKRWEKLIPLREINPHLR
jgi:hypothetical protein